MRRLSLSICWIVLWGCDPATPLLPPEEEKKETLSLVHFPIRLVKHGKELSPNYPFQVVNHNQIFYLKEIEVSKERDLYFVFPFHFFRKPIEKAFFSFWAQCLGCRRWYRLLNKIR